MMKTNKRQTSKLSLSSETLRKLTMPELARAQGGMFFTLSYCEQYENGKLISVSNKRPDTTSRRGGDRG